MSGHALRRGLGWLLVTCSLLTAAVGVGAAGTAMAAPAGGTIKVCKCATDIAADPNTRTVWVVNASSKSVSVISERTRKVVATIKLASGLGPNAVGNLVVDPVSKTIWVFAGARLVKISEKTMKVVRDLQPSGYRPGFEGVVDPARGEIWAISQETIQGISEATGKVLSTAFIASGFNQDSISGLAADPKTGTIFALVDKFSATRTWLYAVNEASGAASPVRKVAGPSFGLVVDPAAGTVWRRTTTGFMEFSATGQHATLGGITISSSRFGPFTEDPTTGSIWMGALNARELSRFSESHRTLIKTLAVSGQSRGITVDTRSRTVSALLNGSIQLLNY